MEPFKSYAPFIDTMKEASTNPFFGVLLGAGFTVLIQSSSGTMGIVIILASEGLIPLPAAVHLMLGAEIGTCADTLLASIGRSVDAFRTEIFHLFVNLITVSVGLALSHQLAAAGQWLAFGSDNLGRQIANAHVLGRACLRGFGYAGSKTLGTLDP
jgi:phosphate:Na+ symporter